MRDFRDAKTMAQTIRAALTANGIQITVGQSLELMARAFGVADWNTLSAAVNAAPATPRQDSSVARPSIADSPSPPEPSGFSDELRETLHRAIDSAEQRSHEHATLEHLLLALLDDSDASAMMRACNVDLDLLRRELSDTLDNAPRREANDEAKPVVGFQRIVQRVILHAQYPGPQSVTGANVLVTLLSEPESRIARLLGEHAMTHLDAARFITQGAVKRGGDPAA